MTHTADQLKRAQLRRRRIVAAVDDLARADAAAKRAASQGGRVPVVTDTADNLRLLLQVVTLWGDEPATGDTRD